MSNSSNPDNPFASGEMPQSERPMSARVPEHVARGVYSSAQLVLDSPKEFVIDFLQGLTRPPQINARVVMTPSTMVEFATTLQTNLDNYVRQFGPPPPMPKPPTPQRPSIQEIYENFKLSDEMLSGAYANQVLIGHSGTEFFFDFITSFYPTPAISSRVYVPVMVVPGFLNMLKSSVENYRQRFGPAAPGESPPPPQPPPQSPPGEPPESQRSG